MISRPVSAMTSATEGFYPTQDCIERFVDVLEVRPEAENRASQAVTSVDASAAHHHATLLLNVAHELFVELIHVAALLQVAEGDYRQLRLGTRVKAVRFRKKCVEIARERELFCRRRAEGAYPGKLQRQPKPEGPEVPGQLGRKVRR